MLNCIPSGGKRTKESIMLLFCYESRILSFLNAFQEVAVGSTHAGSWSNHLQRTTFTVASYQLKEPFLSIPYSLDAKPCIS
jgi:hypothetical protein